MKIPGNHIQVIKFSQQEITNKPQTTTLNTYISSFQLVQKHYHQLGFIETYDPKPQAQNLNVVLDNKTKDPIAIARGILRDIDFPGECQATQPQPQPYTVNNFNQGTQTLLYLYNIHPDTFDVHNDYAPNTTQSEDFTIHELNLISFNISSTLTTLNQKLD